MTAAIVTDLEQTTYDRQRAVRQMVDATRALPPRTDVPLVPVPFERRMESPLWDSLTPRRNRARGAWSRKLTDEQVLDIRRRWEAGTETQEHLARAFGIDKSWVSRIVNGHARPMPGDEQAAIDELERLADEAIAQIRAEHQRMRDAIQRGQR